MISSNKTYAGNNNSDNKDAVFKSVPCEALHCNKEGLILSSRCKHALFCSATCLKATWPTEDLHTLVRPVDINQILQVQQKQHAANSNKRNGSEMDMSDDGSDSEEDSVDLNFDSAWPDQAIPNKRQRTEGGKKAKKGQEPLMVLSDAAANATTTSQSEPVPLSSSAAAAIAEAEAGIAVNSSGKHWKAKFTKEMDAALCNAVAEHCVGGVNDWLKVVEKVGNGVTKKQCRYRWQSRFSPEALASYQHDQQPWTIEEAQLLCALVAQYSTEVDGNKLGGKQTDNIDVDWKAVAATLKRSHITCKYMWQKIQNKGIECMRNSMPKSKTTRFTAEEDALIIKRKAEWDSTGKVQGLWQSLAEQLGRSRKCIARHYWDMLCKKHNLDDHRPQAVAPPPFTEEEDAIIIERKTAWDAEGKTRGLWPLLVKELGRNRQSIVARWNEVLSKKVHGEDCVVAPLKRPFTLEEDVTILRAKMHWDTTGMGNLWSDLAKKMNRFKDSVAQRYRNILAPRPDGSMTPAGDAAYKAAFDFASRLEALSNQTASIANLPAQGTSFIPEPTVPVPFTPEEDIQILTAVKKWQGDDGKIKFHWTTLSRQMNRSRGSIATRYKKVLAARDDGSRTPAGAAAASVVGLPTTEIRLRPIVQEDSDSDSSVGEAN